MVPHPTRATTLPIVEVARALTDAPMFEIVSDSEEGGGSGDEDDMIRGISSDRPAVTSGIQVCVSSDSLAARY
jgi:hypothetical protein